MFNNILAVNFGQAKARVDRLPCYKCGSSDAVSIYENIDKEDPNKTFLLAQCFSCRHVTHESKFDTDTNGYKEFLNMDQTQEEQSGSVSQAFNKLQAEKKARPVHKVFTPIDVFSADEKYRGIEVTTLQHYGIGFDYEDLNEPAKPTKVVFPYFSNRDGASYTLSAQKIRNLTRAEKRDQFVITGDIERSGLFGQQLFKPGMKHLLICEGELDAPSAYQMLGSKYACISVKNGASALTTEVKKNFEYINSFEEIRICFDPDHPGREAVKKLCESGLINASKIRIVRLNPAIGDANDYLVKGFIKNFVQAFWDAHPYTPDDVFVASAMLDECINEPKIQSYNYPWHKLTEMTFGMRMGEFDVFAADTGVGKSTVFKHMVRHVLTNYPGEKIAVFVFEELPRRTLKDLVGLQLGRRLHLPNVPLVESDFREAAESLNLENLIIWGNFGSTDLDMIIKKLEFVVSQGVKFIFLDHLSMITADQRNSDERAALDQIVNYLNNFVVAKNIHMSAVTHTNREGQIRGTTGIEKVAHKIVRLERRNEHPNVELRKVVRFSLSKNRFSGELGCAGFAEFNPETGRLEERLDIDDEMFYYVPENRGGNGRRNNS